MQGKRFGNYIALRMLGKGGMGEVYLAEHPEIGRTVAIKVLASYLGKVPKTAQRFLAEAKIVTRIKHPAVIEIYDFGRTEDDQLYFVMELLEGQELQDVLEESGIMLPNEVAPYLQKICEGLQAAHDLGVVHRDLKPANIFVTSQHPLEIKILDFGIAKLLESAPGDLLTSTGMIMGTPKFIAPEQAAGQIDRIGPRTDIYSLGVILYLMLTCSERGLSDANLTNSRHRICRHT